ncbi:AP 3 complex subunit sigma 2 [Echinococcus multilocularis]|uniref:AP 3 complex subunit sigma 2 n=1 Tax=Echinococcus multilocularis TaxID=6211 RepID=A0A068XY73_ECHMU|nr:AP 3 complex subunit sigma 2 [Echinococcus multilocularis]
MGFAFRCHRCSVLRLPEDERRHNTRAEHIYLARRRCLGYWHGPKGQPTQRGTRGPIQGTKVAPHQNRGINH